jgi:hypothetical protein
MYRAFVSFAVSMVCLTLAIVPVSAENIVPAWASVQKSVALIGYQKADGTFVDYTTGFCVRSSGSSSEFLTTAHGLVQPPASTPASLVLVVAGSAKVEHATIVRQSPSADLALVSIPVGNTPTLPISPELPQAGDQIALGGFLHGQSSPDLIPAVSLGIVRAVHQSFIAFDISGGTIDHGDGGAPLFDPATGVVHGVVEGFVRDPGASADSTSAASENLAISTTQIRAFLNGP